MLSPLEDSVWSTVLIHDNKLASFLNFKVLLNIAINVLGRHLGFTPSHSPLPCTLLAAGFASLGISSLVATQLLQPGF